ncbi:MAG: hypothetical protein QNJ45_05740 [Ardenticatenaceae bacterium]|nr:hypothetical protein [Ardenticatenaceae bacterium]
MTLPNSHNQFLADWIADNLTATDLAALCSRFNLDLAALSGLTRQDTAEQIVTELRKRSGDLAAFLNEIDPLFALPGTLNTAPPPEKRTAQPTRIVNTGFADQLNPAVPARANRALDSGRRYFFWVEIGEPAAGAIDVRPSELNVANLPADAELTIALFGFPNELELLAGQDIGRMRLQPDGTVSVSQPAVSPAGITAEMAQKRLFFPVQTPAAAGTYRLRCHIYYQQLLLQSHLVTAQVEEQPRLGPEQRLLTIMDYALSKSLAKEQLRAIRPHKLSVLLNGNDDSTHGFRFLGEGDFKNEAAIDGDTLQNLIELARGALRMAAWGSEEPFDPGGDHTLYRYDGSPDLGRLKIDLLRLAIRGYRFYDALINQLAGGSRAAETLADTMRRPGFIQLASKASSRLVVPLSTMYDHPLFTSLTASEIKLCPTFLSCLADGQPLIECPCFLGDCPSYGEDDVVCPSGFWGFRHALGHPLTIQNGPEAPTSLPAGSGLEIAMAVSTDPNFVGRSAHEAVVRRFGSHFHYANERPETIDLMKKTSPHLLYFFCHGRLAADVPSIEVGPPRTRGISRDVLRAKRIRWEKEVRPLVFLNGCHTAALSPHKAFDLVSGFIEQSEAAGVIGTEITSFVPLAKTFAEDFFKHFLVEKRPVGEAIRLARLTLLEQGNPLGLIYIPFVIPSLAISE